MDAPKRTEAERRRLWDEASAMTAKEIRRIAGSHGMVFSSSAKKWDLVTAFRRWLDREGDRERMNHKWPGGLGG